MNAMDQFAMDNVASCGCGKRGLDSGEPLYLHQRCHSHTGTRAVYVAPNIVHVKCTICGYPVVQFAVKETAPIGTKIVPPCCPDAPVISRYAKGTGVVEFLCFKCQFETEEVFATLHLVNDDNVEFIPETKNELRMSSLQQPDRLSAPGEPGRTISPSAGR